MGSAATQGTDYWGVLAVVSDWSLPAFNYYRHQGSSRIEAKQALQFSNLELTNSQCISLKKKNLWKWNPSKPNDLFNGKRKKKGQCSILGGGKEPTLVKVPWATENQLPQLEQLQTQAASTSLQPSQHSGNCTTKAQYEVISSNQPIEDRDDQPHACLQKILSHLCLETLYTLFTLWTTKDLKQLLFMWVITTIIIKTEKMLNY